MASFPVRIDSSFLLNIRLIVSVILKSSAVSTALVDSVVSVLEDVFVPGILLAAELSGTMLYRICGDY